MVKTPRIRPAREDRNKKVRDDCLVNNMAVPGACHSTRQQIRLHIRYQRSFCSQPPSKEAAQLVLIVR